MAGDVINLRRVRKAKARAEKEKQADASRLKFGRTRSERERAEAERGVYRRHLDAHRRETDDGEPAP